MRRCESAFKVQAHGVTLVAHRWLNTHEDISKGLTKHKHSTTIGPMLAGCRAPLRLDLLEVRLSSHVIID